MVSTEQLDKVGVAISTETNFSVVGASVAVNLTSVRTTQKQ